MDLQFQMNQLVSLAIGTPEVGAVNFNLLQRFLLEMLKMTDLDSATVTFSPEEVAKLGENTLKPVSKGGDKTDEEVTPPKKPGFHQCPIDPQKVDQLLEDLTQVKFDLEDLTSKVKTMEGATGRALFNPPSEILSSDSLL
ncbi:hypothetical protein J6590_008970 [Homalodisca vitripennis]|nr:hypothetical protein J6590_008970 [Homalodisca vitripennis]